MSLDISLSPYPKPFRKVGSGGSFSLLAPEVPSHQDQHEGSGAYWKAHALSTKVPVKAAKDLT